MLIVCTLVFGYENEKERYVTMKTVCSYEEAVEYCLETPKFTKKNEMEVTRAFYKFMFKEKIAPCIIHVAGTNGTMKGKCYGGGMIPAPEQKRDDPEGNLSLTLFHTSGRLKTLMIFPSIFKGEHVKKKKNVTVLSGKEILVEYSAPRPAQIDGETVKDVKSVFASSRIANANLN